MSLFTLNEYTEKKNFRPQKTIVTYKDYDDMKNNVRKAIKHNLGNTVGNRVILRNAKQDARKVNSEVNKKINTLKLSHTPYNSTNFKNTSKRIINNNTRNAINNDVIAQYKPISHKYKGANLIMINKNGPISKMPKDSITPHNKRLLTHSILSHEIDHKKGFEDELDNHKGQKRKEVLNRMRSSQVAPMTLVGPSETYKRLPAEISANKVQMNTNSLRDRAFNNPDHVKERKAIFKKIEHDTRGKSIKAYQDKLPYDKDNTYEKSREKMTKLFNPKK